ncbi:MULTISPECIES: AAA family ATPase [unclassified Mucilaginibacter]|uniref:AAA family ATPase n=1 Tax=unclassified Mucilaginibacter TaxID=2617802 RepID=UPI002AC8CC57|nr:MULTISPECIES: AAA family ATPase [unclassified Mucilaginibacter]MEB0262342.1 AAA family ATPase [Mucilaginibacter sp. 10I4]MEB0279989.1 AAA family ATPase [Mucilaginibacter sp. 10B2]MEB0302626.1 AAA family ATPase [Mucilaginibacter sp. 5C4]WPX21946.1 AAA family ATPase [Mucilaginibacter sp. 5C4]
MITYIKINGFKSFQNFEMSFTPLTVIAGVNASGKSNLFDALKLLSRLAETDLKTAFSEQRGNADELFTQYDDDEYATEMEFTVEMLVERKIKDNWGGLAELNNTRLKYSLTIARNKSEFGFQNLIVAHESLEKIKPEDDKWAKQLLGKDAKDLWKTLRAGGSKEPFIKAEKEGDILAIKIRQDGGHGGKATPANAAVQTVLGGINSIDFRHAFAAKEEMRKWKFLQLNPDDLREPTKQDVGLKDEISQTGKNLAAVLYRIKLQDPYAIKEISRKLNSFLPGFTEVRVYNDTNNRQYIIKLKGEDGKEFSSRVLSEGTLRLLALCVLEYDQAHNGLLCFEEPENGIHPFRIDSIAQLLKNLSVDFKDDHDNLRQVIVNTHSPVLISTLIQWRANPNVSVWLSKQNTLIKEINGKKINLKVSRVSPVVKESEGSKQLYLFNFTSENERKLTLTEAENYLKTADAENAIKAIKV